MKLTLRQIEVIRAVQISGTITGAAKLLHVSTPGISRLIKHTESSVGINLFDRIGKSFVPSANATRIFDEINEIYTKVETLNESVLRHRDGVGNTMAMAATASIAQIIAPRVTALFCQKYPEMNIDLEILKMEEWVDYLLLEKGDFVVCSHELKHDALTAIPVVQGEQVVIVPRAHAFSGRDQISVKELVDEKLIGVALPDPYGEIISRPFSANGLAYELFIKTRFSHNILTLVEQGLGLAVIDEFSVAGDDFPGVTRCRLAESMPSTVYILMKKDKRLTLQGKYAVQCFRKELKSATRNRSWE